MLMLKPACVMLLFTLQSCDLHQSKCVQLLNVEMRSFCLQTCLSREWTSCRNIGIFRFEKSVQQSQANVSTGGSGHLS